MDFHHLYFIFSKLRNALKAGFSTPLTLTKKIEYKTITTHTTDVAVVDRILAHKSKTYLARITNLKQYKVESTLLDNHTWLLTLRRKANAN